MNRFRIAYVFVISFLLSFAFVNGSFYLYFKINKESEVSRIADHIVDEFNKTIKTKKSLEEYEKSWVLNRSKFLLSDIFNRVSNQAFNPNNFARGFTYELIDGNFNKYSKKKDLLYIIYTDFKTTSYVIGLCTTIEYKNLLIPAVWINKNFVESYGKESPLANILILHEVGHCLFDFNHTPLADSFNTRILMMLNKEFAKFINNNKTLKNMLEDGCTFDIMYPSIQSQYCGTKYYNVYIDLFAAKVKNYLFKKVILK